MIYAKHICDQFSDLQIIQQSLKDVDYFSCLYERYEQRLTAYIQRIIHVNQMETEDILQDAFIKIWRNLNDFDTELKVSSWIYRIVHNEAISFARKQSSFGKNRTVDPDEVLKEIPSAPHDNSETPDEQFRLTYEVLELLPLKYKTVLVLKFIENMSYEEISDVLKMPEGTVATQINRAKKAFAAIATQKNISFTL